MLTSADSNGPININSKESCVTSSTLEMIQLQVSTITPEDGSMQSLVRIQVPLLSLKVMRWSFPSP